MTPLASAAVDRHALTDWHRKNRARTRRLFDAVRPEAYLDRPIALRNPIVFYEGHLPAFAVNTLLKKGLGDPPIRADFETLFERGIDPEDEASMKAGASIWPERDDVLAYAEEADRRILDALARRDIAREDSPMLAGGLAAFTILEHEAMHQETLLYMWNRLPRARKVTPADAAAPVPGGDPPPRERVRVAAGRARLGASPGEIPFGWDNEFSAVEVDVPAFDIDVHDVTNADFLEFVEAGGYASRELWSEEGRGFLETHGATHPPFWERSGQSWLWRGQWASLPLPPAWPVWVSHAEAEAYAAWKGRALPSEAQYHRAAFGIPSGGSRVFPWGDDPPDATRGNFDFVQDDPMPVGSHPAGASAWGVHDLMGNGWEWTSTIFAPLPGFSPMPTYPEYSADFFDGKHWVMKGASPATAKELLRPSFRNWFRGNYPYVFAGFRTVSR
jgi:ergothioneine biosynthesis protein EgtB